MNNSTNKNMPLGVNKGIIEIIEPTLRDKFAMVALAAYLSMDGTDDLYTYEGIASMSYSMANAMMEERDIKNG
jgi:hypothetical protein